MRALTYPLLVVALISLAIGARVQAAGDSICCPADVNGDATVTGADLAIIVQAWGPAADSDPADIDESGQVDAADLALVLGSWGACPSSCTKTLVVGSVEFADGTPVSKAIVVTDFGGSGVSSPDGSFSFEVEVGLHKGELAVTAVAAIRGATYTGTKVVSPIVLDGVTDAGTIVVSPDGSCPGAFGWLPGFAPTDMNGAVNAMTVFDDGTGPALYAGGNFTATNGITMSHLAKWNGTEWSPVETVSPNGMNGGVSALIVFDDGGGPALYAGGSFTTAGGITANRIARWDGASWSSLGVASANGLNSTVTALTVFDDGDGPALYAAGTFMTAGGISAKRIAKWDGISWSPLGIGSANGTNNAVFALTVFDDGGGDALYAGGWFTSAGGVPAVNIAKWNGRSWSALGSVFDTVSFVSVLAVFDDGGGPSLYAGGSFSTAGGVPANNIAKWNGTSWSPLGVGSGNGTNDFVSSLAVVDIVGDGIVLCAGGNFTMAGGVAANRIAKWKGGWSSIGTGLANGVGDSVNAVAAFDDGSGPAIYVGGGFTDAGGVPANHIARWNGSAWSPFGTGPTDGVNSDILALTVFDDGSGPALFAGGSFTAAGSVAANRVARWDGTSWMPVGTGSANGVGNDVFALTVFDDGGGPALFVGGEFTTAGGAPASRIAKWNGRAWSALGSGSANGVNNRVHALTVFDDGGGPELYVGGEFATAAGATANRIARWNGNEWSPLGAGSANGVNGFVYALTVFDDGGGPELCAGGEFTAAGGVTANRIATWNGNSWSSLGRGSANGVASSVFALTVFDDGGGAALYAGGAFTAAGGVPANRIARWNGSEWSSLGMDSANGMWNIVRALTVFDDGSGPSLYAGGAFTMAGGASANRIARWSGSEWSSLGTTAENGVDDTVRALSAFDGGGGPVLYAGGKFKMAGSLLSNSIAAWGCAAP